MASKQILLISGGNTGLGLETLRALCRSETAYDLILAARTLSKGEAAAETLRQEFPGTPSTISPVQLDIADDESIAAAYSTISAKYERLDVLINNAGTQLPPSDPTPRRAAWNQTLNVNVTGTDIITDTFAPLLLKSSSPRLLFITSGTSSLNETMEPNLFINVPPPAGWPKKQLSAALLPYRASKTALNMVVRDWARVLNEDGVKVFAVSPGFLATGLGGGIGAKMGAAHPSVGGELVRDVVEGKRDEDVGLVVKEGGVQPW
ncbi:NAD(P)-binding protein [Aspergillus brunneoviolaceus CBS 621.78]|uniref:NAD(P)-binding protein n=1 Tax=Aspergillus brunneoviolaceus CBS 621.78 TaxID=1450534 RepID=A0ACD1GJX6_9EURO|nr:NAD(P)-binding protein [Aspergillus brunneoviolaceus CBS 621.78]RAH49599.1 NAD(P)-binding protein [Aspergillus brunneoviolaceus CBS 621.78]